MLTELKHATLRIKTQLTHFLTIFVHFSVLTIAIFSIPVYLTAATTQLPASLPDPIESNGSAPTISTDINTPEYVIIRSNEETTFSSETTGKVIALTVKEGSNFQIGDTLVKLDCRLQQADLKKALAQQKATRKAMESARKLKYYGSISEFEFVKASSEADAANADVDKLKTTVEKCTIIAPFTGSVAEIKTHLYETVRPGDALLKVVNTENLSFEIQVPSEWLSWLHIGSEFHVVINDINKTVTAKVSLINPEIEPISQTVKIVGQVSPPEPSLRPGMTGEATFPDHPDNKKE